MRACVASTRAIIHGTSGRGFEFVYLHSVRLAVSNRVHGNVASRLQIFALSTVSQPSLNAQRRHPYNPLIKACTALPLKSVCVGWRVKECAFSYSNFSVRKSCVAMRPSGVRILPKITSDQGAIHAHTSTIYRNARNLASSGGQVARDARRRAAPVRLASSSNCLAHKVSASVCMSVRVRLNRSGYPPPSCT